MDARCGRLRSGWAVVHEGASGARACPEPEEGLPGAARVYRMDGSWTLAAVGYAPVGRWFMKSRRASLADSPLGPPPPAPGRLEVVGVWARPALFVR
ncbi:MAG: hypothetical protein OXG81_04980 [Acidobacteria bacterium]|nr:hypothetical protein [Acidobacteriota bacterium]